MFFKLSKFLATLGPIGYLPASGSWASMLTLAMVYFLHAMKISNSLYALLTLLCAIIAWYCVVYSLDYFRITGLDRQMEQHYDPSEIVIDEVIGCLITFFAVPCTPISLMVGFALFRFFDIFKPLGLKTLEKSGGAWGILLDDIGAGILSNLILQILLFSMVL